MEGFAQRADEEIDRPPLRSVDAAIDELGHVPDPTPTSGEPGDWPRAISGSPSTFRELLSEMADQVGVDGVVVRGRFAVVKAQRRSHELLAEAVDLSA